MNSILDFKIRALELFRRQAATCAPYQEYIALIGVDPVSVKRVEEIPFLPIELFKTRDVYCGTMPPEVVFTSSATTGQTPARHMMERVAEYEKTFRAGFEIFYGAPEKWAIFALLPSYLEREGSSLIYMVRGLGSMFFLHDHDALLDAMVREKKPKILLGVSYALLDLAERAPKFTDTIVMETGGMKGRRAEIPKTELHWILKEAFGVSAIHSEYGMAELTSQAYSAGEGIFRCPPWMRVLVREVNDPFAVRATGTGGINIIDLANRSSCAFIQTQDMGRVHADGSFELHGRIVGSEVRGCNLLVEN